jgi:hypothetical protein
MTRHTEIRLCQREYPMLDKLIDSKPAFEYLMVGSSAANIESTLPRSSQETHSRRGIFRSRADRI